MIRYAAETFYEFVRIAVMGWAPIFLVFTVTVLSLGILAFSFYALLFKLILS